MKLKVRPEDFRVEEKLGLKLKRAGAFSVYRLEKRLWNTLDVIRHLEQRHGMRRIGRAGLKDRYALSTQFLSIPGSGPQSIVEKNYSLRFVGRADQPVSRDALLGNRFTIAGGRPGLEVSWQITAVRADPQMRLQPFAAERDKPEPERGTYLQPVAWAQPRERGLRWTLEQRRRLATGEVAATDEDREESTDERQN